MPGRQMTMRAAPRKQDLGRMTRQAGGGAGAGGGWQRGAWKMGPGCPGLRIEGHVTVRRGGRVLSGVRRTRRGARGDIQSEDPKGQ